jgi:hypothetical protein
METHLVIGLVDEPYINNNAKRTGAVSTDETDAMKAHGSWHMQRERL